MFFLLINLHFPPGIFNKIILIPCQIRLFCYKSICQILREGTAATQARTTEQLMLLDLIIPMTKLRHKSPKQFHICLENLTEVLHIFWPTTEADLKMEQ